MQAHKPQHTGAAALVLRALKAMGCATKQQLAQATGLSVMAAGTAVEHLLEKGRVLAQGRAAATGGRPAAEYAYNADYAHALILCAFEENGRDSLHLRTVDLMGSCVHRTARLLEQARLESFVPDIEAALARDGKIAAVGFGLPGTQRLGRLETSDYKGCLLYTSRPFEAPAFRWQRKRARPPPAKKTRRRQRNGTGRPACCPYRKGTPGPAAPPGRKNIHIQCPCPPRRPGPAAAPSWRKVPAPASTAVQRRPADSAFFRYGFPPWRLSPPLVPQGPHRPPPCPQCPGLRPHRPASWLCGRRCRTAPAPPPA